MLEVSLRVRALCTQVSPLTIISTFLVATMVPIVAMTSTASTLRQTSGKNFRQMGRLIRQVQEIDTPQLFTPSVSTFLAGTMVLTEWAISTNLKFRATPGN